MYKLNGNRNNEAYNKIHIILDKINVHSRICENSDSYMQMHNKLIYKIYSAILDKLIES